MEMKKQHEDMVILQPADVLYWAKKWGVSINHLYNAIMNTSCLGVAELKTYLEEQGVIAKKWNQPVLTSNFAEKAMSV